MYAEPVSGLGENSEPWLEGFCQRLGVLSWGNLNLFSLERNSFGGIPGEQESLQAVLLPPKTTATPKEGGQLKPCPQLGSCSLMASDTGHKARSR